MKKKLNKKGFTLAELLIVVAIIGVLVAIAIPVFSGQLNKAKDQADRANLRSAYAEAVADYLDDGLLNNASTGVTDGSDTKQTITYGDKFAADASVDGSGIITVKVTTAQLSTNVGLTYTKTGFSK